MTNDKKVVLDTLYRLTNAVMEVGIPDKEKKTGLSTDDPNDFWVVLGGLADLYEDEGNYKEAEFFRWCLQNRLCPYVENEETESGSWFRKGEEGQEQNAASIAVTLEDDESNLYSKYFEHLPGELIANHKTYTDFFEAYAALFVVYMKVDHKTEVEFDKTKFGVVKKMVKKQEKDK